MKTLILLGAIALCWRSYAQAPDTTLSYKEQVISIFEHVNLSEVTNGNGLLSEHGFPMYAIEEFTGMQADITLQ
jgi:hypothetical protein